jgi:hypothetical protein
MGEMAIFLLDFVAEFIDMSQNKGQLSVVYNYKKCLLNTTQLAGWMKTGSPKARKHDIRWA